MPDSPFISDFRELLKKHSITAPKFAHGSKAFNPEKPQCLYSGPIYDENEIVAATTALVEGKWAVTGEYVTRFAREFSKYVNQKETVMVNSGSSADLLMLAAAKKTFGWNDGDGVIVAALSFPTSVSAITLNKLTPIFVDIEWDSLNWNNKDIEKLIHWDRVEKYRQSFSGWAHPPDIKAILVSPMLGNPPDMDELVDICEKYGVKLLLDNCDSLGSTFKGKQLSEYAVASTCSYFPAHHISVLTGGSISSNDTQLIEWARCMSTWSKACWCSGSGNLLPNGCCGKRFSNWLPDEPDLILDHRYVFVSDQAYNVQMTEIQGALGCEQMKKIEMIHERRRIAYGRITKMLKSKLGIEPRKVIEGADPSWFGVPILCPNYEYKTALMNHFEKSFCQTRNAFAGNILRQPGFRHLGEAADYPNANQVLRRVFFIGANPAWTEEHFQHIEKVIGNFVEPV